MNIIITILLVLGGIISLVLIIALFMRKKHFVSRDIIIKAPRQKVFDYIKLLKNQDEFNIGAMEDPDRKREFKGTDGTVGYIYSWSGNKNAGQGEKEIMDIIEGEKMESEIRFVKPMSATARIIMKTESLSHNHTKVYWSNAGTLRYPINIMIPMMEKSVAKGMDASLATLKCILEK
ncbi:SRPBCC family protein [Chryseobacterium sp. SIMBA_029]|uniref:SRPBCC family protein n=1 Tax=Chryseobacterium sp. SIMBA_029 TaxID=3085772 RepID=UPI00397D60DA